MQHETTVVKKASKKYKTADGHVKESISKRISLKKDSIFEIGDEIALLPMDEFNKLSDVTAGEISDLKKTISEKDADIDELNESNDKLKSELQSKLDLINELTNKLKASEKKVVDLESDISAKDKKITELESEIANVNVNVEASEKTIDDLNAKVDELNKSLADSKQYLLDKDDIIVDLEKQIAVLNATDISELKQKANELNDVKDELIASGKVISYLQNQIKEYLLLVSYKDKMIARLDNKGLLDVLLNKDVTADIDDERPTLLLIDSSGNPIADKDDDVVDVNAESDNDQVTHI
jgi:chromosome segregation ATPase